MNSNVKINLKKEEGRKTGTYLHTNRSKSKTSPQTHDTEIVPKNIIRELIVNYNDFDRAEIRMLSQIREDVLPI